MGKIIGIYLITVNTPIRRKYYVGQSCHVQRRMNCHRSTLVRGTHDNEILQRHWNKYGPECFTFEVIETCAISELDDLEAWWLSEMIESPYCMNICANPSTTRGIKLSLATRQKMSISRRGEKNPRYGNSHSKATRAKLSANRTGKPLPESTCARMALARMGDKNSQYGVRGSLNPASRPVVAFPEFGGGHPFRFESMRMARESGFDNGPISKCCNNKQRTHKGFFWEFDVGQLNPVFGR